MSYLSFIRSGYLCLCTVIILVYIPVFLLIPIIRTDNIGLTMLLMIIIVIIAFVVAEFSNINVKNAK